MFLQYFSIFWRLGRNARLLLITAGLFGMTIISGISPVVFNLYLLRMGYDTGFIGLVNSMGLLGFAGFSLPASMISARWGSRKTMIAGVILTMASFLLFPLGDLLPEPIRSIWLIFTNTSGSAGMALFFTNSSPLLMEVTSSHERTHAFSAQMAIGPLAGFMGSLIGGTMPGLIAPLLGVSLSSPLPYRYPLLLSALLLLPGIAAVLATDPSIGTSRKIVDQPVLPSETDQRAPIRLILLFSLISLLQVSTEGAAYGFFNVYLDDALQVPTAQIGVMAAIVRLIAVPAALSAPLLAGWLGRERTYFIATIGIAISILPMALIPHWMAAQVSMLGITTLAMIARAIFSVYQMEMIAPRWRPMAAASGTMAFGLSWSIINLAGGYSIRAFGYSSVFLAGGLLTHC